MTESSQTASFNDRSDKAAGDRSKTGLASSALDTGAGLAGSAAAPTRAAPRSHRHSSAAPRSRRHSGAVLARLADELMSSPAITTQTTEPVFSVARLMLDSGIDGFRCWIRLDVRSAW